jgi:hypothetical protein
MIRAANNSENVDIVNLVTFMFSLHSIPTSLFFWAKMAQWKAAIGDARASQLSQGPILTKWTVWATKWRILKLQKNTLVIYSTIALTTVLFSWLIVASP